MRFSIIGAGSLGIALANKLHQSGYESGLGSRDPAGTRAKLEQLSINPALLSQIYSVTEATRLADVVILTVPDDTINAICKQLARHLNSDCAVVHCAGALDSDILSDARARGCHVASLHPLNTFPSASAALDVLAGDNHQTALVYEGDEIIEEQLIPVFAQMGFKPMRIEKAAKPLYHAACVIACNLLTALMDVSMRTAELAHLDRKQFWFAIQPLLQSTLQNISREGCEKALSGPLARGDVATVANQLNQLEKSSVQIASTYRSLSAHALDLAESRLSKSPEVLRELKQVLQLKDLS